MRLIFNGELDSDDFHAVSRGHQLREIQERLGTQFEEKIEDLGDYLANFRLQALAWLISARKLDIRIALRAKGIYHEKVGVIYDREGDYVLFQGSGNETDPAISYDRNYESFNVFRSWIPGDQPHIIPHLEKYERLWNNQAKQTLVIDFPEAAKNKLIRIIAGNRSPRVAVELDIVRQTIAETGEGVEEEGGANNPKLPLTIGGEEYRLKTHQFDALTSWKKNRFRGMLALATGAGKTITAIHGAVRLFEQTGRLFLVIAVPYQNLADQWISVLANFSIYPIRCYESRASWQSALRQEVDAFRSGAVSFGAAVVVNKSLKTAEFQSIISRVPNAEFLFVGDECHHHRSAIYSKHLPQNADLRLGLSATPQDDYDFDGNARLISYYGEVVSTYELSDALRDRVLTPYRYHLEISYLDAEESEHYISISKQIAVEFAKRAGERASEPSASLTTLLGKRARLLAQAADKLKKLNFLLNNHHIAHHTLFYCGEGLVEGDKGLEDQIRHLQAIASIAHAHQWNVGSFTAEESLTERRQLLGRFRDADIDALVAIRCLDEGIDVPDCRRAYILASSTNSRQFIQRRGRILRRAVGKEYAEIFDFLVLLPDSGDESIEKYETKILESELKRVVEFARLSLNWGECYSKLQTIVSRYHLEHLLI